MANEEHLKILEQGVEEWNQWRRENPSVAPYFGRSYFKEVNLKGVNLRGANLTQVKFIGADLRDADLSRADLFMANLSGADLSGAKLFKASLAWAELTETRITNADFTQATMESTILGNVDLSSVIGLDTIRHLGRSIIDINTVYRSKGNIPEIFLRGAGIPDSFIVFARDLTKAEHPIEFYSCFISYSHADKSFARRLHDGLQGRGIRCWLDEHELLPGQKIFTEVDRGIRLWDKVLLCCSEDSLKSWWVDKEITTAFEAEQYLWKERGEEVLKIIPLNLDGYLFSDEWKSGLRADIRARLAADFTGWETDNSKFETEFERLIKALRADAGGRELPPQSRL